VVVLSRLTVPEAGSRMPSPEKQLSDLNNILTEVWRADNSTHYVQSENATAANRIQLAGSRFFLKPEKSGMLAAPVHSC
jgi:hypothetical protein